MLSQPFAISAALIFLVAIPLVIGLIPRNPFYGFRIQKTLADERVWYSANRFAGVMLMLASIVYAAVALVWPYSKHASDNFEIFLIHLAGFGLPLLVAFLLCWAYARRL
ncbi:MAG: SdpI family protein [Gammaproteobacteria bacterium]